ncbi:MAG: patatin-like phospholipase family protein [Alphaproteobacteria bacterium]|nr:patatin-like phospholipase family protein [Alphaproteobacteria bacterium]
MPSSSDSKTPSDLKDNFHLLQSKSPQGIGIALGGGMARGFAHIGVLKTLNKHGIYPSIVAGTSIGALVGGCYLSGKLTDLENWAKSLNRLKVFSYMDIRVKSASIIGGEKLKNTLHQYFDDLDIESLPHPFIAICSDLNTGHEIWLRKGSIIKAMMASFALPGVFPPVEHNHRLLVDGALVNPVPVSVCQALGSRLTIAVDLHGDMIGKAVKAGDGFQTIAGFDLFNENHVSLEDQKQFKQSWLAKRLFRREANNPSLFGVMMAALGIFQDRVTRSRLAGDPPDVHIKPHIGHIGMLEFERAEDLIRLGEEATERAMPKIRAAMQVLLTPDQRADQDIGDIPLQDYEED